MKHALAANPNIEEIDVSSLSIDEEMPSTRTREGEELDDADLAQAGEMDDDADLA